MKKIINIFILILLCVSINEAQASDLSTDLSGMILLQVDENGEAWYVYSEDLRRYYLGRPDDAFSLMRELGLGIVHADLKKYLNSTFPSSLFGLIMLDVEANGEAYYVYPKDMKGYYLGRPADAFSVMRNLGLGISNLDLEKIEKNNGEQSVVIKFIVDTGQTKCYDSKNQITCPLSRSFFGQDAQYLSNAPKYRDNNDGTVTDIVTSLTWQQDPGSKLSYYEAVSKANGFSLAGYSDWRVPNIKEMYSLINFSGEDISGENGTQYDSPFISTDYFRFSYGDESAGERAIDSQWVTSNVYVSKVMNNKECFFGVNFADGRIKCYPTIKSNSQGYFSILVRGEEYGINDFQDNGDNTITDSSSGFMWQQNDSGVGMNWEKALDYCNRLELAGYNDWRLPNTKELEYIVDYTRSPDTTDSSAIDPVFDTSSITNEKGQADYPFFWTSTTHTNQTGGSFGAYVSFGRAMGKMNGIWMDVHGAGAQRSDLKTGTASDYPDGHGPQGDAIRIDNYVRCVRGGANQVKGEEDKQEEVIIENNSLNDMPSGVPQEAISTCENKFSGNSCSF